jgi:hypothetical protein
LSTYGNWNPPTPNYFWKIGLLISLLAIFFQLEKNCPQHIKTYYQWSYNGDGNKVEIDKVERWCTYFDMGLSRMKLDEHKKKAIQIILINWEWKDFGIRHKG